jgi:hypothetical protein
VLTHFFLWLAISTASSIFGILAIPIIFSSVHSVQPLIFLCVVQSPSLFSGCPALDLHVYDPVSSSAVPDVQFLIFYWVIHLPLSLLLMSTSWSIFCVCDPTTSFSRPVSGVSSWSSCVWSSQLSLFSRCLMSDFLICYPVIFLCSWCAAPDLSSNPFLYSSCLSLFSVWSNHLVL